MNFNHWVHLLVKAGGLLMYEQHPFTFDMNWNDQSTKIANDILEKMEDGTVGSYTRDDVIAGLKKAAYMGMQFECDNWVLRRR